MKTFLFVITILAIAGALTVACGGYDSQTQTTLIAIPTIIPETTPTVTVTVTPTPDPMDNFVPSDPATGVGDAREALIEGYLFQLELASTDSERAHGLMDRLSLPEDAAMVFVYQSEEYRNFWMKNTLIPLDILFLDAEGVVVDVQTMQSQIGVSDGALKVYGSALPARYALEMNAGLAESIGIAPGTQVLFR
jgi:uncharacterized membrane protein (UPF0127 family)